MITLWHNPRCSKSRMALKLLEDAGASVDVRLYIQDSPTAEELDQVLHKLGLPASALIRTGEKTYKDQQLDMVENETELLEKMSEMPILIERPIAIKGQRAIIGRPPENVLSLLD